jgi:c-di-GMP-binding flagellar brake protein YcgR
MGVRLQGGDRLETKGWGEPLYRDAGRGRASGEAVVDERRRRVPRQEAGWPGRYRFEGEPETEWGRCRVIDISIIGAGTEVFGAVPPIPFGRRRLIQVETPAGAAIKLQLLGEVRNFTRGPEGGTRIGIEFTDVSETERSILEVLSHMRVVW